MLIRTGMAAVMGLAGIALATPIKIQPDEAASKDTFIYGGFFGGWTANQIVGQTIAEENLGVTAYLRDGNLESMWSLVQFPLDQINPDPGERVVLGLYSKETFLPQHAESPSSSFPVSISVYAVRVDWTETSTFNSIANSLVQAGDAPLATVTVNAQGQVFEFDITDSLAALKSGPYYGFVFRQDAAVTGVKPVGLFAAGAGATDPTHRPYIAVVPEPATLGLLGLAALVMRRRR